MSGRGHRLDSLKTRRIAGGLSITRLAQLSTTSDLTIKRAEAGEAIGPEEAARILTALAPPIALTSNTQANPTEFTTSAAHNLVTGDTVLIAGVTGANADPNGTRVVTVTSSTKFTVPINCSTAGGTGGTATPTTASVGFVSQL